MRGCRLAPVHIGSPCDLGQTARSVRFDGDESPAGQQRHEQAGDGEIEGQRAEQRRRRERSGLDVGIQWRTDVAGETRMGDRDAFGLACRSRCVQQVGLPIASGRRDVAAEPSWSGSSNSGSSVSATTHPAAICEASATLEGLGGVERNVRTAATSVPRIAIDCVDAPLHLDRDAADRSDAPTPRPRSHCASDRDRLQSSRPVSSTPAPWSTTPSASRERCSAGCDRRRHRRGVGAVPIGGVRRSPRAGRWTPADRRIGVGDDGRQEADVRRRTLAVSASAPAALRSSRVSNPSP